AALELQVARSGDQALFQERRDALHLLPDRYELRAECASLRLAAGNLMLELRDLLPDDVALALERGAPAFELAQLAGPYRVDVLAAVEVLQVLWEDEGGAAVELGAQPLLGRAQHDVLLGQHVEFRARLAVVEHDQQIARLDPVALPHAQLLDDAAVEMLHALAIAFDLDDPVRDHGAVERRGCGPGSEQAEERRNDHPSGGGGADHRLFERRRRADHRRQRNVAIRGPRDRHTCRPAHLQRHRMDRQNGRLGHGALFTLPKRPLAGTQPPAAAPGA